MGYVWGMYGVYGVCMGYVWGMYGVLYGEDNLMHWLGHPRSRPGLFTDTKPVSECAEFPCICPSDNYMERLCVQTGICSRVSIRIRIWFEVWIRPGEENLVIAVEAGKPNFAIKRRKAPAIEARM
jgi:hypothetical protein